MTDADSLMITNRPAYADAPAGVEGEPAGERLLWVDASNGAAGDMLLAALLDAGADLATVRQGLAGLRVEPITLTLTPVRRHGLRAGLADITAPESTTHRHLSEVLAVIGNARLPKPVAAFAMATFRRLAAAEARVHDTDIEHVHFHEVGALDAIADIVGCALGLHTLGLLAPRTPRIVTPVAVGGGTVATAHGRLPVPPPAVLELLTAAGLPLRGHPADRELCTPTGAALLAELATGHGPVPDCRPEAVGVGAGQADPPSHPNVLRVLVGAPTAAPGWLEAPLWQVEATIDDLDPRIWPDLLVRLRAAGAADAWCVPALMRKGRPGQVLCVLVDADRRDVVCRLVFTQTTTLGVRMAPLIRRSLARDQISVPIGDTGDSVSVKRGYLAGALVSVQPEYDEACALARRVGVPVADVLDAARAAARRHPARRHPG